MRNINRKNPERGAVVVEFALVLPLLMLLLMGIIEFGLLFYNQQVLTNASREGARAGIGFYPVPPALDTRLSVDGINTIVVEYCDERLIRFNTATDPIPMVDGVAGNYPETLSVTVSYVYTFLVPSLLGFPPGMLDIQLVAKTEMRMELAPGS
jgi:Flp pilus assembly protein TadG